MLLNIEEEKYEVMSKIVIYKSKTGFTKKYASIIANELGCKAVRLEDTTKDMISTYDTVIFGSRIIAGSIDELAKFQRLILSCNVQNVIMFVTGATPNEGKDIIDEMWTKNLGENIDKTPHFYMQSGINYSDMPFFERMMMKIAGYVMKHKKNKSENDLQFEKAISTSYNISSEEYAKPLIEYVKSLFV